MKCLMFTLDNNLNGGSPRNGFVSQCSMFNDSSAIILGIIKSTQLLIFYITKKELPKYYENYINC